MTDSPIQFDVVVLGAGASGLMCAAQAGYRGRSVLVVDHAPKAAAKIRISGGGKCNFTNVNASFNNYICANPHFVKSALSRYTSQDFIDLVDRHGLEYEERELGKLFCAQRAGDLIQILRTECDWAGVELWLGTDIRQVSALSDKKGYLVLTSQGVVQCESLVVATGALSFPKLKATDLGYRLAKQFGLAVNASRPGLVPLLLDNRWLTFCQQLSGIALDVSVGLVAESKQTPIFNEAILFTHQGLSGPGILQISNYWLPGQGIEINLLPNLDVYESLLTLKESNQYLYKWLNQFWPKKFTQAWLSQFPMPERLAEVSHETLKNYAHLLTHWAIYPSDTAGYDKAEVTLGGVDTDMIQSKDCQVKHQPGLYFTGEVLDVTGQLGGYNFQWAWSSGFAAAQTV
ncbi:BaiN/RdsA family NAD(P)/FAD-dependent oxidoreductase [Hydrogenovibrio kuenenii]|uniref:NAD(P)/FAD-dependent oxidoreductase n=1 Tax=Hydrogenovibrio kuenenii TaxID=63658 RepID=UPI00056E8109|nr:NAD(P)/FAD-dependent oxidoreductase [Hydrogenovibrio kuenenii]